MPSEEGMRLSRLIQQGMEDLTVVCRGLDDETANRAPGDRWSPKQILSHLAGVEGVGLMPAIRAFLDQDTPLISLDPANPFFTGTRSRMTVGQLLNTVKEEYKNIADLIAGLSEDQLGRKAHIPLLKETDFGEYPTLAMFVEALAGYHVSGHIDHMKEILAALRSG